MEYNEDKVVPQHLAIIMDGNGRWASKKGFPRVAGHKVGAESVRSIITESVKAGISKLSLFAFSEENWHRPEKEVHTIMRLLVSHLKSEKKLLNKQGVRLHFTGDLARLDKKVQASMQETQAYLINNKGLQLNLSISYSGKSEITNACRKISERCSAGDLKPQEINQDLVKSYLYNPLFDDIDFLIRTSGEQRLSNFMLWQCAYAELYFTSTYWPDFREQEFYLALEDFAQRQRRFGNIISEKPSNVIPLKSAAEAN